MPAERSLLRRTMISLPLPAILLAVGTIGMAWANSNSPERHPSRADDTPNISRKHDGESPGVSRHRNTRKVVEYWTPKRMRDARPAEMPVHGVIAP